jgi:hypothetical protein
MPDFSTLATDVSVEFSEHRDGRDARELLPDVCREMRRAVVDMIREDEPSSVLGLLIASRERQALTVEAIAGLLCKSVTEVEWTIEMLEDEDLCVRLREDGVDFVSAFAAYSDRNE